MDEPAWDPGVIIDYWLDQPDNHEIPTRELVLKSWSLWGIATFPGPSDGAKLVRSTLARHSGTGDLKLQYFGTKEVRLPVFSFQLSIHPDVQKKVCAVEAIERHTFLAPPALHSSMATEFGAPSPAVRTTCIMQLVQRPSPAGCAP